MCVYITTLFLVLLNSRPTPNYNFIPSRKLTAPEAKGALVPFYRAVHPDLFHSYPHHKVRVRSAAVGWGARVRGGSRCVYAQLARHLYDLVGVFLHSVVYVHRLSMKSH